MKLVQGHVIGGVVVVVDDENIKDGALVTVLVEETYPAPLTSNDEDELIAASAEVGGGEYLTTTELFELLRRQRSR